MLWNKLILRQCFCPSQKGFCSFVGLPGGWVFTVGSGAHFIRRGLFCGVIATGNHLFSCTAWATPHRALPELGVSGERTTYRFHRRNGQDRSLRVYREVLRSLFCLRGFCGFAGGWCLLADCTALPLPFGHPLHGCNAVNLRKRRFPYCG